MGARPIKAGELTPWQGLDVDETPDEVSAVGPVILKFYCITNKATATRYVKFYDKPVASVTVGTTTPKLTLAIPGTTADDDVMANVPIPDGIFFADGLTIGATTAAAVADTGAPGTGDVIVNVAVGIG